MNIKEYLDKLGISFCTDRKQVLKNLETLIGKKEANKLFYAFEEETRKRSIDTKYAEDSNKIYEIINNSLESSLVFSGTYNYERLISEGKFIEENPNLFGKRIIDIGCLNGILTCYIALMCPDSYIVGIDTSELSINNAKKLAQKLDLNNVEFICKNAFECHEQYDTVFSSYVMHENLKYSNTSYLLDKNSFIKEIKEASNEWAKMIAKLMNDNGNAILFERIIAGYGLYGVMESFIENGLSFKDANSEKLPDGEMVRFVLDTSGISKNIDVLWHDCLEKFENSIQPDVYESEAISRMSLYAGKLLKGYMLYHKGELIGKILLTTSNKDSTALYELVHIPGKNVCFCYDVSYKDALIEDIKMAITNPYYDQVKEIFYL